MQIYITTNLLNGKQYIGRDSLNRNHYLGSGIFLKQAIVKYGKENFKKEILEQLPINATIKDLIQREYFWLDFYKVTESDKFYNISKRSGGFSRGDKHKLESKIKNSNSQKLKMTEEFKLDRNPSWRITVSENNKGRNPWNKGKKVGSEIYKNRKPKCKLSDEDKIKIINLYNEGYSACHLGEKVFNCSHHTILKIVKSKTNA